jgi:glycosyltransferase involved in cell wall biosynthesis
MAMKNGESNSPRVLFVSHETTLSGAPMQMLHLVRWLRGVGWKPSVAAREHGPIVDLLEADSIPVVLDPLLFDPAKTTLRALCRKCDVVVANTIASWLVVQIAHDEGVPALWYLHEHLLGARFLEENRSARASLHLAQAIVVPTRQTAAIYEAMTRVLLHVVPYGIPSLERTDEKLEDNKITFLTLGPYQPRKGQDILLDAFEKLKPGPAKNVFLTMAGRFVESEFLEKLKRKVRLIKNVQFLGPLDRPQAIACLERAAVVVCPSRDEAMPITILEAMALGKAVIVTDVGGVNEWIHDGSNGLLVPPENPGALASAIARCIADENLIRDLGKAARRTFELHFSLDRYAKQFAALLTDLVSKNGAPVSDYQEWIARYDRVTPVRQIELKRKLRALHRQPLMSILLPVFNPPLDLLQAAIDSVRAQLYERWELCIADDASTDPKVRPFLEERVRSDARIKIHFRKRNGHIAACSNSALAMATGEWCALLDQDDLLAKNALAVVADEIEQYPDAGLIYSDEDKIDIHGTRFDPFFKPDWNPERFLGQNYISHLGVYETSLVRRVGGFREGFEGSQDYDLALRCVERLRPEQIRHIPRILYHWRTVAGSVALTTDAKPYAKEAGRRAVADHFRRRKIAARVEPSPEHESVNRVVYGLPVRLPLVSIIVPTRDRVNLLQQCLRSIREKTDYPRVELIVVDNGSIGKKTQQFLKKIDNDGTTRVLRKPGRFNFSYLINAAAAVARGEILAFVNNDIVVENPEWLSEMVRHALRPEVGAVGARLWFPNGTLQHGGVILGLGGVAGHSSFRVPRGHPGYFSTVFLTQNYSAVTAACMLVRKKVFVDLGGFDEVNLSISYNDVDFCLRLRERGLQIVWTPYANLIHKESASRGYHSTLKEWKQFQREGAFMQMKWGAQLLNDPSYNLNLSVNWRQFDLAFPPRWKIDNSPVSVARVQ